MVLLFSASFVNATKKLNATIAQDATLYSKVLYIPPCSFVCPSYGNKLDGDMDVT